MAKKHNSKPCAGRLSVITSLFLVWASLVIASSAVAREHHCTSENLGNALQDIVQGAGGGPVPGVSVAIMQGDSLLTAAAGCAQFAGNSKICNVPMRPETKFRVASVSKMAAAFAVLSLAKEGIVDLERDVSDYLEFPFHNPAYPDQKITLRHLLSHTGGVRDPEQYWLAAPGSFKELINEKGESLFSADGPPGVYFVYANINFGFVAMVMERATGQRFDKIVIERLAEPYDLDIGFNWSGVSQKARKEAAILYRQEEGRWIGQTDSADILDGEGPYYLAAVGLDRDGYLESYQPGDNPTLFSPQGGLRASSVDLVKLVRLLAKSAPYALAGKSVWRYDPDTPNGEPLGGLMVEYGLGAHTGSGPIFEGRRFVGHSGDAYGLFSGAWQEQDGGLAFAYAVTGSPETVVPGTESGFMLVEERLISLALDAAKACQ